MARADLPDDAIAVIPAILRHDASGGVLLVVGASDCLMTTANARRLAQMLNAIADRADAHAAALNLPDAKALDAAHGPSLSRA